MIVANLIYDTRSLRTCTLTCYSWYLAAVPRLHRTLITHTNPWDKKFLWPNPLYHMDTLGLLPLLKVFWVRGDDRFTFSPRQFNSRTLHNFSTLNNIRRLLIECLDIHSFIPKIRQYFGHFLPTVRELTLVKPKGSFRQIIYFVGFFQHLEDLEFYDWIDFQGEAANDPTLIPPFVPPLRGWLMMAGFARPGFVETMIDLFGGVRFRYMALFDVDGTRLLLGACAETLEVLRLYPSNPHGE